MAVLFLVFGELSKLVSTTAVLICTPTNGEYGSVCPHASQLLLADLLVICNVPQQLKLQLGL